MVVVVVVVVGVRCVRGQLWQRGLDLRCSLEISGVPPGTEPEAVGLGNHALDVREPYRVELRGAVREPVRPVRIPCGPNQDEKMRPDEAD